MRSVPGVSFLPLTSLLAVVLSATIYASAQSRNSCTCDDVPYLIDQLNQFNASLEALQRYEQTANQTAYTNEIAPEPNPTRQTIGDILDATLTDAQGAVMGNVNNVSVACAQEMASHSREVSGGTRTPSQIRDHILRSRSAYGIRANDVLRRLTLIQRACRLDDWFGSITATEILRTTIAITNPPRNRLDRGSTERTEDLSTRTGTIRLMGRSATPSSTWTAGGSYRYNYISKKLIGCKGGLKTVEADREVTNAVIQNTSKSGGGVASTEVGVGESDNNRSSYVSFQLAPIKITASGSKRIINSGGCPGDDPGSEEPINATDSYMDSLSVGIEASVFPGNPLKVSGSKLIDLSPASNAPGVTISHTVRVTVALYKLR